MASAIPTPTLFPAPALTPIKEGFIPFLIPSIDEPCFTHYKVYGDLSKGPVIVGLHGGPGGGMITKMAAFWPKDGIPVILYDQIGCGGSSLLLEKKGDEDFWQMPLFVAELDNLLNHFGLHDGAGFHLIGSSFGAMLAADFATTRPRGLRTLVLTTPFASRKLSVMGHQLRKSQLPLDVQEALQEGADKNDFQSESYKKALLAFHKQTWCRLDPWPPRLQDLLDGCYSNAVYQTMYGVGPTVLGVGSMRDWSVISRLHRITASTLLINGEFDTAYEEAVRPFFELIPRVRWITYPNASHGVMMEVPAAERMIATFIKQFDTTNNPEETERNSATG